MKVLAYIFMFIGLPITILLSHLGIPSLIAGFFGALTAIPGFYILDKLDQKRYNKNG